MAIDTERALAVKERATPGLMNLHGVVGVGLTEQAGRSAILVLVREATPDLAASLPAEIEGHPVVVEAVGEIRPL